MIGDPVSDDPTIRTLKIEADGDPWKGVLKPKIRIMGRWFNESSPVSVVGKSWAAISPASRRIVVPLLPQFSGPAGALSGRLPLP